VNGPSTSRQPSEKRAASSSRGYSFEPTPAVVASRARSRYVSCSLCRTEASEYLFHRVGVRFVRCAGCGFVYVNPVGGPPINYFDMARAVPFVTAVDRRLAATDFAAFLEQTAEFVRVRVGSVPRRTLLVGRYLPEFAELPTARRLGLEIASLDDTEFERLALDSSVEFAAQALHRPPELVILHEFLEACSDPRAALGALAARVPESAVWVVTYANVDSLPARLLRRYWPGFFEVKSSFFTSANLSTLMATSGFLLRGSFPFPSRRSLPYLLERVQRRTGPWVQAALAEAKVPIRVGHQVAVFTPKPAQEPGEKLSIVLPVYNEARYVRAVLDALLALPLSIPKEIVVVESQSSDGTRDIVRQYEAQADLRVIYQDRPRGKGHAVRAGLREATGSILLIQDADFEYDLGDYDALLAPILQRRTSFVLGSRTLGLEDWKVRRFAQGAFKGQLMNLAQVGFAKTFNLLYQQRTTDVNTMFKVFRRECLEGIQLESDGFELDIELVCKLVRAGYAPLEVPVNYVSRGYEEGKKIHFWPDAARSYWAFFKHRL
jgi:hypothetical protein